MILSFKGHCTTLIQGKRSPILDKICLLACMFLIYLTEEVSKTGFGCARFGFVMSLRT